MTQDGNTRKSGKMNRKENVPTDSDLSKGKNALKDRLKK
jgi:hypothetical protein